MNEIRELSPETRNKIGRNAGIVGVAVNLLLFAGKLTAGILASSVSVIADAVNNLTDAASSILVLIAYLISAILWKITNIINLFVPIIPTIDSDVCIISVVLCINVISLLRFWGTKTSSEDEAK